MAINFTVPKVHLLHLLFLVVLLSSANLFTEYVLSLFSLFFVLPTFKSLRNWLIKL